MIPQSLCFSTQNDLLLIGTCSGILTVIPTKLILSESATTVQHGSKKVRVVKAKDEAEIGRRAMPVSISWWATNESKALAIVGTNHGLVIIIDLVDGKEVSLLQNVHLCRERFVHKLLTRFCPLFTIYHSFLPQWKICRPLTSLVPPVGIVFSLILISRSPIYIKPYQSIHWTESLRN